MQEIVIALLLIVNGEIKEHRIQDSMSDCLKGNRKKLDMDKDGKLTKKYFAMLRMKKKKVRA